MPRSTSQNFRCQRPRPQGETEPPPASSGDPPTLAGLYELLAALPARLQPHVDSQEDLTFLWDVFGEKSLHSLVKLTLLVYGLELGECKT
ncbi:hypothetical protein J1605_001726 [Eschrichtius robustus]|uniref:L27 domain-containing protein n=1 Tax=Eschrichtius robustus TaxID=9764 RepID=A0AB34I3I1_ESCRO|nr:hypothetical protein J1605_001726 [Eschrichtius robustus]